MGEGAIRHELVVLARRRRARKVVFSPESPCKWHPTSVIDPQTSAPFTAAGAWEFIADLLEKGHPIERIELRKPPGKAAYAMEVPTEQGDIYIKLQLRSGVVLGRSFHYSTLRDSRQHE